MPARVAAYTHFSVLQSGGSIRQRGVAASAGHGPPASVLEAGGRRSTCPGTLRTAFISLHFNCRFLERQLPTLLFRFIHLFAPAALSSQTPSGGSSPATQRLTGRSELPGWNRLAASLNASALRQCARDRLPPYRIVFPLVFPISSHNVTAPSPRSRKAARSHRLSPAVGVPRFVSTMI